MAIFSLKNPKEFDLVKNYGIKKHGSRFIVILATNFTYITSPSLNPTFLGMKVSKKFSKKAVIRNKVKRNIRHLVRNLVKNPSINTKNTAFIVIPKRGFESTCFVKLTSDFHNTILRASS